MLRLDWNILFNIINILILFVLMRIFLFKPINNILEKRQAAADELMKSARDAQNEAAEKKQEYEMSLKGAEKERASIIAKAKEDAVGEYTRIVEDANEKAKVIIEKAASDAQQEKAKIMQEVEDEMRDLVLEAVSRVTGSQDSAANDHALLEEFLRQNKEA